MGLWDFSDLLDNVICLFSTDATLLSQYQKKFSMILVDEFQDTNPQQVKLLKLLLTTRSFIFAVGDDDQAIYGFRGADIRPILEFNNHFPNSQILKLEINYRSTPKILTLANRVSSDKIAGTPKVLVSGTYQKKSGVPPQIKKFSSESEMAQWIVRKVEEIGCDDNGPVNGIACLFRTNRTLAQLQNLITTAAKKILPQLQFITVHSAKGLEFDVVFICDLEASVFPASSVSSKKIGTWVDFFRSLKKKPSHDELLEEEKRLYYVAVTRARKHLFLLHAAQKENYGRTRSYQPSSFLNYSTVLGRLRVRRLF
jgi:superfamily I DNA/RNA helicase